MLKRIVSPILRPARRRAEFDDIRVFVVSFPKCGRTWLRVMAGKALCEKFGLPEKHIFHSVKLARDSGSLPTRYTHEDSALPEEAPLEPLETDKSRYRDKRVIFLVRDPRDVAVSFYFEATKRRKLFEGSISSFIRSERHGIDRIVDYFRIWIENRTIPEKFLLVRYEELYANPLGALRSTLEIMGAPPIEEMILRKAIEYAGFENMKRFEREGRFKSEILRPADPSDPESFKVRRGRVGGFMDYLSPEDVAFCDAAMRRLPDELSY